MPVAARSALWRGAAFVPLVVLVVLWSARPLSHDDMFWHMRTGETVLREGIVPTTDSFSYTRRGESWVSHEWGFGLLLFTIHRLSGFEGLRVFQVALVLAIVGSLAALLGRTRPVDRRAVEFVPLVIALGVWAAFHELKLNAALCTTLFLVWELLLLQAFRREGRVVHLVCLALLFVVWSNLHSGVLFGIMILGFWWIEAAAPSLLPHGLSTLRRRPGFATARIRFGLLLAAIVISIANPNGIEVPLYPVRLSLFLFSSDIPLEMGHFTAPTPGDRPGFFALVAVLLGGLLPLRQIRKLTLSEILSVAAFFVLSLRSNRFIFDFVVVSSPILLKLHGRVSRRTWAAVTPIATAAALTMAILPSYRSFDGRVLSSEVPAPLAAFMEHEGIRGNLLNHQNYGGYLGWRLGIPVFWDGRNELFGPLMEDLVGLSLAQIVERYDVEILLLTEREYRPLKPQIRAEEWGVVYWDDYRALFVRRTPRFREVLARNELRVFPPFGKPPDLRRLAADPEAVRKMRTELDRVLRNDPESQRALFYHALVSVSEGDLGRAKDELEKAARIRPNQLVTRTLLDVMTQMTAPPGSSATG